MILYDSLEDSVLFLRSELRDVKNQTLVEIPMRCDVKLSISKLQIMSH